MKRIKTSLALAATGAIMLGTAQSRAQVFTYTEGDLLLDFRLTAGGGKDLTIDIGPLSNFKGQTAAVSLNQFSTYLTATFGSDLSGLSWSVAAEDTSVLNNLWN